MMSVPREGAERLAEIFRKVLALSETSRSDHSQSMPGDDSIELFDSRGASGTAKVRAKQQNHPSNESQDC